MKFRQVFRWRNKKQTHSMRQGASATLEHRNTHSTTCGRLHLLPGTGQKRENRIIKIFQQSQVMKKEPTTPSAMTAR